MTEKKEPPMRPGPQATIERHRARGAHPDNANSVRASDHVDAMHVAMGHHKPAPPPLGVGPAVVAAAKAELTSGDGEAEHEDKEE